ncbi:transcriptional regulator, LacI family [Sanguibacter gelidistatuariae]|uniref:Transcriptional regulator, LacI family n=1 Tax=Sanguibacter gelidistatuariae TaxID=1814289 RepID=A0A1G6UJ70_9MICO|nr:LacI family DNA-binding transcriptional regulator [Sanguibacter gelidistatuariae]SDD41309.1 transcriptional regulator, LacI family [Sanguibacter gelidistatuariae]
MASLTDRPPASGVVRAPSKPATIKDVAAAAAVSIATVSRALNGGERVLPETVARVRAVALALGYTPSRTARGLVTGRSANVGVILPDVTNPFFAPLLAAIESAAQAQDHGVLIGDSREDPAAELRIARRMTSQADGIILVSSRLPDDEIRALAARVPVVLANRQLAGLDSAVIDVAPGFTGAIEHLAALGHTRVLYLAGPAGSWSGQAKERALHDAAAASGIMLTTWGPHRPTFDGGRQVADRVLASGYGAVICYDDLMALGLQSRCADRGVDVPGELSIIGCDDALPDGMARPALTTIEGRSDELGQLAADLLLDRMARLTDPPQSRTVTSRLIIRASTAPTPHKLR